MNLRTITLTATTDKKATPQRFLADYRNAILEAVETTLSNATGQIRLRYPGDDLEDISSVDELLYRVDTWLAQRRRDTIDTGLSYFVGGKRYSITAAMVSEQEWYQRSANTVDSR